MHVRRQNNLFRVLATSLSSLTRLGLDEKVDQEKGRKECSKDDSKVSTELNLKGNSLGRKGLNDGVKGESRGSESGNWKSSSGGL